MLNIWMIKLRSRGMARINIQINEDLERSLSKIANKQKRSLSEVIAEVLNEWLEETDLEQWNKSLPKKSPLRQ